MSLLLKAGYTGLHSLKSLSENKLDSIEKFFDENKEILNEVEGRHSQMYKNMKKFKFLPAHRDIILSILESLPDIEAAMQREHSKTKAKTTIQCLTKESTKSEIDVKKQLLNGLKNVAKKLKFDMFANVLTDSNLVDFEKIDGQCQCGKECNVMYKCCFVCPVCPKKYTLHYKRYWMSSNATKHIKHHISESQSQPAPVQTTE